jgi:MoaA/NifB/PqqE/SkfB family radical SAM enzyme
MTTPTEDIVAALAAAHSCYTEVAAALGANRYNIMPLIPRGGMGHQRAPARAELDRIWKKCRRWPPQFRGCTRCRADAILPLRGARGELPCGVSA